MAFWVNAVVALVIAVADTICRPFVAPVTCSSERSTSVFYR
jgi:hypothetical protein